MRKCIKEFKEDAVWISLLYFDRGREGYANTEKFKFLELPIIRKCVIASEAKKYYC